MAAALMALASCSKDANEATTDVVADGTYVEFSPELDLVTSKGTPVEGTVLKQNFGVFGYQDASSCADMDDLAPNFMFNQLVYYSSSSHDFSYLPKKYWPEGEVSFFAYTPYEILPWCEFTKPLTMWDKGYPVVKFKVKSVVKDQDDFMISEKLKQKCEHKEVKFTFKHALTKVGFVAGLEKNCFPGATVKITEICIKDVKDCGILKYKNYFHEDEWWCDQSGSADYNIGLVTAGGVILKECGDKYDDYTRVNAANQYVLGIPQSFKHHANAKIEVKYTISTLLGGTEHKTAIVQLNGCNEDWDPGCSLTYCLKIKADAVDFDAVIQPWEHCYEELVISDCE